MLREVIFSTTVDDNAALDPERIREITRRLGAWADQPRPKSNSQNKLDKSFEPSAIGRLKGNRFSARDVFEAQAYFHNLISRGRAWLSEQRKDPRVQESQQAQEMTEEAERNLDRTAMILEDFVEAFKQAEREIRLDDLPPRSSAAGCR